MPNILLFTMNKSGLMPYQFRPASEAEVADLGPIELARREVDDLITTGVWAPLGTPEAEANWVRYGQGGEVWAGRLDGPSAPVAKIRGKGGRRVGERVKRAEDDRWKTNSVQMPDATKRRFEDIAARRTEAEGRKVTFSEVINDALNAYKDPLEGQ